jgi:hypothetical protein
MAALHDHLRLLATTLFRGRTLLLNALHPPEGLKWAPYTRYSPIVVTISLISQQNILPKMSAQNVSRISEDKGAEDKGAEDKGAKI